jgi:hypothetical protein
VGACLTGALIGRWWALWVIPAFGLIHAIPVYLGWLPGYLSTWEGALWWGLALALLMAGLAGEPAWPAATRASAIRR